jgi:hypothetical protein
MYLQSLDRSNTPRDLVLLAPNHDRQQSALAPSVVPGQLERLDFSVEEVIQGIRMLFEPV